MLYIHQIACISPQHSFVNADPDKLVNPVAQRLTAIEPSYDAVPPGVLRRMGKGVRMGVGAALAVLENNPVPDGIVIGTTNSGKDDCVKFLNQVIEYEEGMLTPMNFVQSTPNAVAAQIGLLTKNHGYNITHVHPGLAFEFAVTDAGMLLRENPDNSYLLGAVDDISTHNYYFQDKGGWYKKEDVTGNGFYETNTPGSVAGEAAVMFLVKGTGAGAIAAMQGADTLYQEDESVMKERLKEFIAKWLPAGEEIDLLLTGENGDSRLAKYYTACESVVTENVPIARYKHMSGEYPTAAAMGLWVGCTILQKQQIPGHMIKRAAGATGYKNVLLYNNHKGIHHSFMLVSGQ